MRLLVCILSLLFLNGCSSTKSSVETTTSESINIVMDDNTLPVETEFNTVDEQMEELDSEAAIAELTIDDTPPVMDDYYYPAAELSEETPEETVQTFDHGKWDALLKKHVTPDGGVDYMGFTQDKSRLRSYIAALGASRPDENWTKDDKLAYWINAYNALTVDLIIRNLPLESIKDINDPWKQRLWKFGDKWINLDEIEHQILRKMGEPRIHFGIVCASYSCPKLLNEAFTAAEIDSQLTRATREFLSDPTKNQISENEIKLSKLFQWFAKDFKQNGSLIDFLNTYSEVSISAGAKKSYLDYNWELND